MEVIKNYLYKKNIPKETPMRILICTEETGYKRSIF